ncbi:hypothetical protein APSETT444_006467 [Aspergillus pseudonomiae]
MWNIGKRSIRMKVMARCLVAAIILSTSIFWKGSLHSGPFLSTPLRDTRAQLSHHLYPLLEQHKPQCSPPALHGNAGLHRFSPIISAPQKNYLVDPEGFVEPMQVAHDGFVQAIRNTRIERAYTRGTKGIVSSAGGKYLPTFIIFLRLLRRTGARLPVELFVKDWIEYEPMISQGAPGEGDKDTFILAASALGENFYTVSEKVVDLGHPAPDGGVLGAAMLHADPIEDYELTRQGRWRVRDESVAKAPRGYWVHAHSPKFNAGEDLFSRKTRDEDGQPGRAYTSKEDTLKRLGFDAERAIWEETKTVTCTLEHAFESWKTKVGLCESVTKHWDAVFESPSTQLYTFTDA